VEASKQCGRNRLMEIAPPVTVANFFAAAPASAIRLIADPAGQPPNKVSTSSTDALFAAIGPEGGFTGAEIGAAQAGGWQAISLGKRVLRVETAAVAVAALASTIHRV